MNTYKYLSTYLPLIVASADFILTSNEVNKNDKPSQLLKFFWLLPHIFVEFTTKIRHITLRSSNGGAGRHRGAAGSPGRGGWTKNAVRRYYGLFITNFLPKTSNCFISMAFFEKITPILVNRKLDDANITG